MTQPGPPTLSIVVPVYGCAGCLETLAERVHAAVAGTFPDYELILVDDASPDRAWNRIAELAARHPQIHGIRLTRNFGQHPAISAGLAEARGAVVVVMDCDLQDRPEEIPALVAALDTRHHVALAHRQQRQDSAGKRFGSWAFYRILQWLTGVKQDHGTANFGAYSRQVVDAVLRMPESNRFFPLLVKWSGFPARVVPVQHEARSEGRSGYSLRRLLRLALDIALSYSDKPLRLMTLLGLAFAAVSVGFAGYSVVEYLRGDIQVAGFTSIIASIWLTSGVIVSSLGLVGLYVGRIFLESKRRPWYLVQERTGGKARHGDG
jgi:glycosyltransferase involved in cell wall biosynthesis